MKFESALISQSEIQSFLTAGFVMKQNLGEDDVYLSKGMTCKELPYVMANIVDEDNVWGDDACAVDLLSDGTIQLVIFEPDYIEQYSKKDLDAWLQMATDAGVKFGHAQPETNG